MTGTAPRRSIEGTLRLNTFKQSSLPSETQVAHAAVEPADAEEQARHKAENLRRERALQRGAKIRRAQQSSAVLTELRVRWPHLFTDPVPLAVGIRTAIVAEMGSAAPPRQVLGRALNFWTHKWAYLEAIAAGVRRIALDGSDAGEPAEDERQHAREELAQREAQSRKWS